MFSCPHFRLPLILALAWSSAMAGPLQQATITKTINDVRVIDPKEGARSAAVGDIVKEEIGVKTGLKSRAELLFQDNTLTRLGAETFFSFTPGTRDLTLQQGTILLQVPKGLGGAKIKTAAVTAAITGTTIMMEYLPGQDVKVLVLEGSLRLSINSRMGEAVTLTPGRMLLMKPNDKHLPEPVDVDLAKIMKTSTLTNGDAFKGKGKGEVKPLPSTPLIDAEISRQQEAKSKAGLVETNLVIKGKGNAVTVASSQTLSEIDDTSAQKLARSGKLKLEGNLNETAQGTQGNLGEAPSAAKNARVPAAKTAKAGSEEQGSTSAILTAATTEEKPAKKDPKGDKKDEEPKKEEGKKGDDDHEDDDKPAPPTKLIFPASTTPLTTFSTAGGLSLNSGTTLDLASGGILVGTQSGTGGIFLEKSAADVPADYLFGSTSAFDTTAGLNAGFGQRAGLAFPTTGIAVYRFNGLSLAQRPALLGTSGRADLALVSETGVTGAAGYAARLELTTLRSVFLGAQAGSITLPNDILVSEDSRLRLVELYSRTGDVALSGNVTIPGATLHISAANNISFTGAGVVQAGSTNLLAGNGITISKPFNAVSALLNAPTVQIVAKVQATQLSIGADSLTSSVDLTPSKGNFIIGAGGIQAPGRALSGDLLQSGGAVSAGSLSFRNQIEIAGALTLPGKDSFSLAAPSIAISGGIEASGKAAGDKGARLSIVANQLSISSAPGGVNGITANGADATLLKPESGDGGDITLGTLPKPIAGDVTIDAPVTATSGGTVAGTLFAGKGGNVSVVSQSQIAVNASVKVSDDAVGRSSKDGGTIRLESRRAVGPAITVSNSGQLLSLLNAVSTGNGGKIEFVSAGGDIVVNGGTVQADRGTIDIRNNGGNGLVNLTNATLRADVVKAGAFGQNGQLLIGGGSIDANSAIKLYAPGSNGTVRFTDHTTLNGTSVKSIVGNTVTIDNTKHVTVSGPAAQVYTNKGNYSGSGGNGSTTGKFMGTGAVTLPRGAAPSY